MRREIDSNLKRKITRLWRSKFELEIKPLKQYIYHSDQFVTRKLNPKATETYIKSGFSVLPNSGKVLIPKKGFDSVSIRNSELVYKKGNKTEHVYLGGDYEQLLAKATHLSKGLKRNQLLSFKVGDNASSSTRYLSLADMHQYLTHVLIPRATHGKKEAKALFNQISIVTVENDMPSWMKRPSAKKSKAKKAKK